MRSYATISRNRDRRLPQNQKRPAPWGAGRRISEVARALDLKARAFGTALTLLRGVSRLDTHGAVDHAGPVEKRELVGEAGAEHAVALQLGELGIIELVQLFLVDRPVLGDDLRVADIVALLIARLERCRTLREEAELVDLLHELFGLAALALIMGFGLFNKLAMVANTAGQKGLE